MNMCEFSGRLQKLAAAGALAYTIFCFSENGTLHLFFLV